VSAAPATPAPDASGAAAAPAVPPQSAALADAQRILGLFVQGLAGHYLHLKPIDALVADFRPQGATTDGAAIYLPESVGIFATRRLNLGVYRVAILHQLGFYENGTFAFSLDTARALIDGLPAEPAPARPATNTPPSELERFFGLWDAPVLMRRLLMVFEDHRIDLRIPVRYPGARADLARVLAHALGNRPAIAALPPLVALLEGLVQYTLGASRARLIDTDPSGLLARLLDAASRVESADATVYDSAQAAVDCFRSIEQAGLLAVDQPGAWSALPPSQRATARGGSGGEDDPAGDDDPQHTPAVGFRGEVLPDLVQRQMRARAAASQLQSADPAGVGPSPAHAPARHAIQRRLEADRAVLHRAFGNLDAGSRSFLYDEWDYLRQTYLSGWCRLFERRLRGEDFGFIGEVRRRHRLLARRVRHQFGMIRPQSRRRVRRVLDGEELELDAVIETVVDRRAGREPDDRVHARREKGLREVAAAFLLDMSASTDYPVPDPREPAPHDADGEPQEATEDDPLLWGVRRQRRDDSDAAPAAARRRVIDVARESLALMCEALEALGDGYAVYGFSGYGRDEVEFYVAKEFRDRLSPRTWAAIAAMTPRRSTRMGTAIRHAATRLRAQEARVKLLVIVSDGYPEDRDYGPERGNHEYAIRDTAMALAEAGRSGVQTFCVTVDRAGHDYLRTMCADERYLVIDEVEALPEALTKVYRTLTS